MMWHLKMRCSQRKEMSHRLACHPTAALMDDCVINQVAAMVATGWTHSSMAATVVDLQRMLNLQSQMMRLQRLLACLLTRVAMTWTTDSPALHQRETVPVFQH